MSAESMDEDSRSPTPPSRPLTLFPLLPAFGAEELPRSRANSTSSTPSISATGTLKDVTSVHAIDTARPPKKSNYGILSPARTVATPGSNPSYSSPSRTLKRSHSLGSLPHSPSLAVGAFFGGIAPARMMDAEDEAAPQPLDPGLLDDENSVIPSVPLELPTAYVGLGHKRDRSPSVAGERGDGTTTPEEPNTSPPPTPRLDSSPRLHSDASPQSRSPFRRGPTLRRRPKFWNPSPLSELLRSPPPTKIWRTSLLPSADIPNNHPKLGSPTPTAILKAPEMAQTRAKLVHPGGRKVKLKSDASVAPGETIMASRISFATLHTRMLTTHCSGCLLAPSDKVRRLPMAERMQENIEGRVASVYLRCSRCKVAKFCGARCYAKNAMSHFLECRALAKCQAGVPSAEIRLLAKAFRAGAHDKVPSWIKQLNVGCSEVSAEFALDAVLDFLLGHDAGDEEIDWSRYCLEDMDEALLLIEKIRTMMFPLKDGLDRVIGWAVAVLPSRIGHSCTPNAFVSFPEGVDAPKPLRVIANSALNGDTEVTISYINQGIPCQQRDQRLNERGFEHQCAFCVRVRYGADIRWSVRHQGCPNAGLVPFTPDPRRTRGTPCTGCYEGASATPLQIRRMRKVTKRTARLFDDGVNPTPQELWLVPTERRNWAPEYQTIGENIALLGDDYSDSFYSLLRLRHRYAASTVLSPRANVEDLTAALDQAKRAYLGCRAIFNGRCPILVQLLVLHTAAEIAISNSLLNEWTGEKGKGDDTGRKSADQVGVTGKLSKLTLLPSPTIGGLVRDENQGSRSPTTNKRPKVDPERRYELRRAVQEHLDGAERVLDQARGELGALRGGVPMTRDEFALEMDRLDNELRVLIDRYGDMMIL